MSALTGAGPLLRTSLRHERRSFAPWIALATLLSTSSVLFYPVIFPNLVDRLALAVAVGSNPALGLLFGPAFDLSTADGFNAWRSLALAGFLTAIGAIFTVVRTTRGQEDSGQAELLASGVMGRGTRLATGVGLGLLGALAVGLIAGIVTGMCGGGWESSMLLAATFTATGWMFTGIAAITAQLGADSRTASSLAVGTLAVLFLLRGFAYSLSAPAWTIWANPLGWMTETRPASGDHWWPLFPALALTVLTLVIAFALQSRRDFGQGAIPSRPGPVRGRVRSTWRLALRINTGPLLTWTIAFIALGTVFGYFTTSIHDILREDSAVARVLAAGATTPEELTVAFIVTILSLVGILAAIPGVQTMLRVRTEEIEDRVEPLLAGAISRTRYYAGNVLIALIAPTAYTLIAGTAIAWLASGADIGVGFADTLLQALVAVPAVWTVVAISIAVIGAHPSAPIAAWAGVLLSYVLTILGPTFKLSDSILAISPFWHVPRVAEGDAAWWGLVWISIPTILFVTIGFVGFRRRDIASE